MRVNAWTQGVAIALALASAVPARAGAPAGALEVRVERVRPKREKHETVRFLKENRDFIRRRFDLLREKPLPGSADAHALDPRWLEYSKMLAGVLAESDSMARVSDANDRRSLLANITELADLERELDRVDRALAAQRDRLGILQADFTGRQSTALVVVLSGWPAVGAPDSVAITLEDGSRWSVTTTAMQREALRDGGVLQVFHAFVEPREQTFEIGLVSAGQPASTAFVTLDPERDRLSFLALDLSAVGADGDPARIRARTWLHDETLPVAGE